MNPLVLNPGQYLCAKTISFRLTLSAVVGLLEMMEDGGGGGLGKDSSIERFYDCTNCMKTFKVSSVTKPSAEISETKVSVSCPVCDPPNTVTLPQGAKFIVTPPN